jgi:hypothetical protein
MKGASTGPVKRLLILPTVASIISLFLLTCSALMENAFGQLNRYWVALEGDQHIPFVNTGAIGFVGFKFSDDYTQLIYNVNVHNIDNITGAYLYHKTDNQNASLVLDLLKKTRESNREDDRWSDKTKEGQTTGTINLGGVTKENLSADLYQLMLDGLLYVIVHTKDFPNGEIRGNSFVGMDDVFHDADEFDWD